VATIALQVREIGANAFALCTRLTEVTIEPGCLTIGPSAFAGCRGIKTLEIPDTVQRIAEYAFADLS
jgi:hypothetical protein